MEIRSYRKEGGCTCSAIRYRLLQEPLFINACHCTHCQRSTGSAFMLSLVLESKNLRLLAGEPRQYDFIGGSGQHYDLSFCGHCGTPLWGGGRGRAGGMVFIRAGTLDHTRDIKPGAHIYVSSKQPWLVLDDGIPQFEQLYDRQQVWPAASLARLRQLAT